MAEQIGKMTRHHRIAVQAKVKKGTEKGTEKRTVIVDTLN
jgi:DNA primase large subunit